MNFVTAQQFWLNKIYRYWDLVPEQCRQRFFYCFAVKQKSMQLNHVSCNSSRKLCFLHLYWRAIISHHQPRPIPLQLSSSQIVELSNIILQVFCNWCCPEDIKWRRGSSLYAHSFSRTPIPARPSINAVVRSTYYMKLKMSNISYGNVYDKLFKWSIALIKMNKYICNFLILFPAYYLVLFGEHFFMETVLCTIFPRSPSQYPTTH